MAGLISVLNSALGSSLPSGAINYIAEDFHITGSIKLVLPISMYLVGYVLGPLLFGPLSEAYGRKVIMVGTFTCYLLFTLACALSPNYTSLLIFRLFCGMNAAAPIAVVAGLFADVFENARTRGRAMAWFMMVS